MLKIAFNNNKQPQAIKTCVNGVCASNLVMVGSLTMKLGTLMYHDESSSKQKLQACKQQQTAPGKNGVCAYKFLVVGPLTMKLGTLIHHDKELIETEITRL